MAYLRHYVVVGLILVLAGSAMGVVAGVTHTIYDRNSSASFNVSSSMGMYDWIVEDVDHLNQQWFWYDVGEQNYERSISTLTLLDSYTVDTNKLIDPCDDTLSVTYGDGNDYASSNLVIDLTFTLAGGSPGQASVSDMTEKIQIINKGQTQLDMSFFQYADFDLGNTPNDDLARLVGVGFNTAQQKDSAPGMTISETVVTKVGPPDHYEVGIYPSTLNKLQDGNADDLSDVAGPIGPNNVTWAYQWDFLIGAGQTVIISKDKGLGPVPEPLTMLGVLMGVGGVAGYLRKRR